MVIAGLDPALHLLPNEWMRGSSRRMTVCVSRRPPMQREKPPFRADEVGSLLRSAPIKEARAKREQGAIAAADFKAIEDREVEKIIKKQEEVGLSLVTDGEYRRSWWHLDFFWGLTGCEKIKLDHGIKFHGVETRPEGMRIVGNLD